MDNNFFITHGSDLTECDIKINSMLNVQEKWSTAHNSHAELEKYKCLHLICHTDLPLPDFLCTGSATVIKCMDNARLLGVKVDGELWWRQHVQLTVKKGMVLLTAVNRLTQPLFGLPTPYICKLFMTMVVPKVEYTLPIWYTLIHTPVHAR